MSANEKEGIHEDKQIRRRVRARGMRVRLVRRHLRHVQGRGPRAPGRGGSGEGHAQGRMGVRQLHRVRPGLAVLRAGLRREGAQEGVRDRREVRTGACAHREDVAGRTRHRHPRGVLRRLEGRRGEGAREVDDILSRRRADEARARVPALSAPRRRLRRRHGRRLEASGKLREGVDRSRRQEVHRGRLQERREEAQALRLVRKRRDRGRPQGQAGALRATGRVPGREGFREGRRRVRRAGRLRRFTQEGERTRRA